MRLFSVRFTFALFLLGLKRFVWGLLMSWVPIRTLIHKFCLFLKIELFIYHLFEWNLAVCCIKIFCCLCDFSYLQLNVLFSFSCVLLNRVFCFQMARYINLFCYGLCFFFKEIFFSLLGSWRYFIKFSKNSKFFLCKYLWKWY